MSTPAAATPAVEPQVTQMEPVLRLSKDLIVAARTLGAKEIRYLVDAYYGVQEFRKASGNQVAALEKSEEPSALVGWLLANMQTVEGQIKRALDAWTDTHPVAKWSKSIVGIGPVIAAGLLAHIEIEKAPTAGHIWRFAGLDPTVRWEKKQKRPWNARLKTLCWKIGESFVKQSGREKDFYGKLWRQRKEEEQRRNDAGLNRASASDILGSKRIGKTTDAYAAYSQGKLPPAHVHARAKRWAVKLFLSHWQQVAWEVRYGERPERPYAVTHVEGHSHLVRPPNWPMS